jgi:hypothetical protein
LLRGADVWLTADVCASRDSMASNSAHWSWTGVLAGAHLFQAMAVVTIGRILFARSTAALEGWSANAVAVQADHPFGMTPVTAARARIQSE